MEAVPDQVAAKISRAIDAVTIGIGAGPDTDAQVLVAHDVLGLEAESPPFARRYLEAGNLQQQAFAQYVQDVASGNFPPRRPH
jgi:Ketopantoate hydroxymethyltransferase